MREIEDLGQELEREKEEFQDYQFEQETALEKAGRQMLKPLLPPGHLTQILRIQNQGGSLGGNTYFALWDAQYELQYTSWAFSETINAKVSSFAMYV